MKFIDGYVKSPLSGLAPWVLLALLSGPGRFEEAAAAALGLSLLTLWVGTRRGVPVHMLEGFGVVYFAVMALLGLLAPDNVIDWLELWAGELSNIALALFAIFTLIIRKPFTIAYARDTTPREHWDSPLFYKINFAISAAWALAFTASAVAGAVGDAVLRDNGNFWTAWIIPIGVIIGAVSFTEFYPDYASAKFAQSIGEPGDPAPPLLKAIDWLPPFVTVTGIAGWVSDALPDAAGIALVVAGVAGSALMKKLVPSEAPGAAGPQ